jgi:hypothetical protein
LGLAGTFAPALVALALTALSQGRPGVRSLLAPILQWRLGVRWYMFAVSYILVIKIIVAVLHRIGTGLWPHWGDESPLVMLLAIPLSTPLQFGEEIGWRGYALPRLAQSIRFGPAALVLGIVWACWHLPLFFVAAGDKYGQSFPIWSLQVIALSVAMAWLYVRTHGSLLLMMLMHAAVNNTKDVVRSGAADATSVFSLHASFVTYLTVAVMWIAVAYFLFSMPQRRQVIARSRR